MNTDLPDKALEAFTELIIEQMENLSSNWEQPWINAQMKGLPENLTGRRYSGVNAFLLFLLCAKQRYTIPCFLTFAQAKAEGLMIKKGARSFPVVYYNFIVKEIGSRNKISFEDYKKLSKDEQDNYHVTAYMKNYNVFNVSQTNIQEEKPQLWEGLLAKFTGPAQTFDVNEMVQCKELDSLIAKQGWLCKIFPEPGSDACYIPSLDEIHIPEKKQFKNGEAFYGTLLHEMTHSTGIESRLNRNMSGSFGSNQYGREELVAELTAALTLCSMGITTGPKEENMRYIKGWCENIKENPRYLMTILSDVSKANTLIHQEIEKIDLSLKETEQVRIYDQSSDITLTHIETRQSFHFSDSNIFVEKDKNQICIAVPIPSAEGLLNASRMMTEGSRLVRSQKSALNPETKLTELVISPIDAFPFILDEKKIERQEIKEVPLPLSTNNEETANSIEQESNFADNTHPLLTNPTLKDGEMCHLQRVFEQTGTLSFTGSSRIQDCEDVAWIFRMLENSAVENSFVVYVSEEKAVVQHLCIGTFSEAHVPMQPIIAAVEKLKPSQLYLVHNHPNGSLKASTPDKMMIAHLIKTFDNIDVCGIIINQTSGKYALFTDFVDEKLDFTKKPNENVEIPVFSFSRLVFEKDYTPDKLEAIRSSEDVAKFVSSHRLGERDKLNIIVLDSSLKITANIFSDFTSASTQNAEQIAKEAVNATILFGGHSYILNSNMKMSAETCKAISDYSKKFSGNSIEPNDMIFEVSSNSYVSAADEYILHDDINSYKYSSKKTEELNKERITPDEKLYLHKVITYEGDHAMGIHSFYDNHRLSPEEISNIEKSLGLDKSFDRLRDIMSEVEFWGETHNTEHYEKEIEQIRKTSLEKSLKLYALPVDFSKESFSGNLTDIEKTNLTQEDIAYLYEVLLNYGYPPRKTLTEDPDLLSNGRSEFYQSKLGFKDLFSRQNELLKIPSHEQTDENKAELEKIRNKCMVIARQSIINDYWREILKIQNSETAGIDDHIFNSMKEAINIGIPVMNSPFDEKNVESFKEFASEYGYSPIMAMKVYEDRKTELGDIFCSLLKNQLTNNGTNANSLNLYNMDSIKKVDESLINWDELKSKFGITKEMLEEKGVLKDMLYFKKSSELLTVSYETANGLKQFDARVQFTEKDKSYSLRFYPVKENLDLSKPYMGYTFTDEDQKNMLETGNLGKVATIKTYGDVEKEAYLSVDPLTKEVVHVLKDYIKIKDEINGVSITGDLKNQILDGKAVFLEGMKSAKGNTFDAFVQIDANRHGIGFSWPKPELIENIFDIHQIKGVPIDNTIQTKLANGEKIEMTGLERRTGGTFNAVVSFDPESKKLKFDFPMQSQAMNPNEIFIPNRLKGVTLSDKQKISISNGEKVLVQGMKSAKGPTYDAYVFINKKEGKLDMEFPVKSEFLGVKFSPEQMEKMQAGNAVWVSGLRKKGDGTFKAPVLWNAKTGKFEFQQLKKSEAVAPVSPSPAPTKEKKEKQEDKPEEKSQKQKNPKVTNEDNGKKKGRKI